MTDEMKKLLSDIAFAADELADAIEDAIEALDRDLTSDERRFIGSFFAGGGN